MPIERPLPLTFLASSTRASRSRPSSAAAPTIFSSSTVTPTPSARGVERVLDGHVVVGDDGFHPDAALRGRHLRGHLEVHDVAGVVLDNVQDAGAGVHRGRGGHHLVGDGRGEDLAAARGVQHAEPDVAAVHRLVAGAAAGDESHLAGTGGRPCAGSPCSRGRCGGGRSRRPRCRRGPQRRRHWRH